MPRAYESSPRPGGGGAERRRGAPKGGAGGASDRACQGELRRTVRVARVRWMGHPVPRQRLGQRVLERRRLKAKLLAGSIEHVAGRTPRIGSVRAGIRRHFGEWNRVKAWRDSECARYAFDQASQAHPLEGGIVRLVIGVLAEVARERAGEADVLHP